MDVAADAGSDISVCKGGSVQLNATGGVNYDWTPEDGLSNSKIADPIASPTTKTTYVVRVTDSLGYVKL